MKQELARLGTVKPSEEKSYNPPRERTFITPLKTSPTSQHPVQAPNTECNETAFTMQHDDSQDT